MHETLTLKRTKEGEIELKLWHTDKGNVTLTLTDEQAVEIKEAIASVVDRGVTCEKVSVSQ